jgi:ferredoxin
LQTLQRSWELHYACRSREYGAFLELLGELAGVRVHLDEEANGAPLNVAARLQGIARDAHIYCCGPAPMLKAFEAATASWPRAQIHVEYFTPKEEAARAGGYVVELAKSGLELPVPPGKTILQVLVDAGIDVASSCEEGVCGACETRVLAGRPDHRDAILSDDERAAGKSMMVCCSGALSERLVLDL